MLSVFKADGVFSVLPPYFHSRHLRLDDVVCVARFRMGSHSLQVERGRWSHTPWLQRRCTWCQPGFLDGLSCPVDDEFHLLYDCQMTFPFRTPSVLDELTKSDLSLHHLVLHGDSDLVSSYISVCRWLVDDEGVVEEPPAQQPAG